jgi:hypothetical protein
MNGSNGTALQGPDFNPQYHPTPQKRQKVKKPIFMYTASLVDLELIWWKSEE